MPVHVERVDKVAGILEQCPVMHFVLWQCSLSGRMFTALHGGEQTSALSTACKRMPATQPSGQDHGGGHKRADEPGAMIDTPGEPYKHQPQADPYPKEQFRRGPIIPLTITLISPGNIRMYCHSAHPSVSSTKRCNAAVLSKSRLTCVRALVRSYRKRYGAA